MTANEIIRALDGADVFLRNRANSEPAPLNEYDIEALIDIANVCDEAANLINSQKAEIENMNNLVVYNATYVTKLQLKLVEAKAEAVKEFVMRFEKKIRDVKFTLGQTWEIQSALKEVEKEMVGEGG